DECPSSQVPLRESVLKLDPRSGPGADSIKYLVSHHVALTSTLPVFETFVPNRAPLDARVLDAMLPEAREAYLLTRSRTANGAATNTWPQLFKKEMDMEREFVRQGGLLLAGLDPAGYGGVIAGYGDQREVELLVEAGFTPLEAIKIATSNGAEWLGDKTIGSLETGKSADIVVIKGDPSTTINDIEKVELVFKDGIGYDSAKLQESAKNQVGLR